MASPSSRLGVCYLATPLISQEQVKLRTSNLADIFTWPIRIKAHPKFWRKGSVGVSRGCPNFWVPPIISGTGKAIQIQIWPLWRVHLRGPPIRIKTRKKYREKGAWAYPGAAQFFWVPPIISGMGKATDFKFCRSIHRVDRNKSP